MTGRGVAIFIAVALVMGAVGGFLFTSLQGATPTRVPMIEVESPLETAAAGDAQGEDRKEPGPGGQRGPGQGPADRSKDEGGQGGSSGSPNGSSGSSPSGSAGSGGAVAAPLPPPAPAGDEAYEDEGEGDGSDD